MQTFNILKKTEIEKTFRVQKVIDDFDVKIEHSNEHFVGKIDIPKKWNIGLIVGNSGTGKSTIAKEIFKNEYIKNFEYKSKSVIDDMPQNKNSEEIEKMFYAVGFGSVPSWLKPYSVLSNGEKMRVDLARALLEKDKICFDEFTSVVDRNVAETMCIATNKAVKKLDKQFIAVSCHYDIIEWLQPDWIFDTNIMQMVPLKAHEEKKNFQLENAKEMSGQNLESIII